MARNPHSLNRPNMTSPAKVVSIEGAFAGGWVTSGGAGVGAGVGEGDGVVVVVAVVGPACGPGSPANVGCSSLGAARSALDAHAPRITTAQAGFTGPIVHANCAYRSCAQSAKSPPGPRR